MGILIADSTNSVTFTPSADVDSVTLAVTVDGEAVDIGTPAESEGVWSVTIASGDVPALDSSLDVAWTLTSGSQTRKVVERYWVDTDHRLVSAGEAMAFLESGSATVTDRAALVDVLEQVEELVREYVSLPLLVPPRTMTRRVWTDSATVWCPELVTPSAVVDEDGNALTYIQQGERLTLHAPYTGDVLVTGEWGREATPQWARRAILATVRVWWLNDYSTMMNDPDVSPYPRILDIPNDVKRMLDRHRWRVI